MRYARLLAVFAVFVLSVPFVCSQSGSASPVISIDENKMRFRVEPRPVLELPLVSAAGIELQASVHLELLNTQGKTESAADVSLPIAPGNQILSVPWSKPDLPSNSPSSLYWYRLLYRITPRSGSRIAPLEGIVQLGRIMPGLLRIRISGNEYQSPSFSLPLRVYVDDPATGKALPGIPVEAQVDPDLDSSDPDARKPIAAHARTDSRGYALLRFKVPGRVGSEPTVEVRARRGRLEESQSVQMRVDDMPGLTVSTDKPIYQPDQTLHVRVLALGSDKNAIVGGKLTIKITDDDDNVQFQQEVKTSRFGVARADWEIPARATLGPHRVRVEMEAADGHGEGYGTAYVQIGRYDLPQFTVQPLTDKPYYLPGEKIKVEVTAGYLFGQPVTRGQVRIARDSGREWDSEKQQWKDDTEELQRGEFDASGKFYAVLDLSDQFKDLEDRDYRRYQDVRLVAYVTDLSTRRTEQKRFTARLSKQPIHIYVVNRPGSSLQPLDLFITTSYPDGTPASLDVDVSAAEVTRHSYYYQRGPESSRRAHVARLHTNRYGVGHLHGPSQERMFPGSSSYLQLELTATDGHGQKGTHTEEFWTDDKPYLKITAARRLLRDGESVQAEIESSLPDGRIFVELVGTGTLTRSQQVELRHGHAGVEFPWEPEFLNRLNLIAYSISGDEVRASSTGVFYPRPQELDLGLQIRKTTYKPGEPAVARFQVRSPDGHPVESALGIVVFDQAVAERVRSDADFGRYGFFYGDYYDSWKASIAGVSYRDLISKPLTGPVSPDLELLAEALLSSGDNDFAAGRFNKGGEIYSKDVTEIFSEFFKQSLGGLDRSLAATLRQTDACPTNRKQLVELLAQGGLRFDDLRDPWGMPYEAAYSIEGANQVVEIVSRGPDKIAGTSDDFTALKRFCVPYFMPIGRIIDSTSVEFTRRTGDYIRDYPTLARELQTKGVDLNALRDPWGHPYRFTFDIQRESYRINVTSAGPDGIFDGEGQFSYDDVPEWQSRVHYFEREAAAINAALDECRRKGQSFPTTEAELKLALEPAGINLEAMRDLWGRPYRIAFSQYERYADHFYVASVSNYGSEPRNVSVPVTQRMGVIELYSFGPENKPEGRFTVAKFDRLLSEQNSKDPNPQPAPVASPVTNNGMTGAITGTVTDSQGAVVAGAQIKATDTLSGIFYTATSGGSGEYELTNLPAGKYTVEITARGFKTSVIHEVPVSSSNVTRVDAKLAVGETSMTVEVSAEAPQIQTSQSQVTNVVHAGVTVQEGRQTFTPRVRKYFPETLVWQPELITDRNGRGELKFQMADNITAWKVSVVGSTVDGTMGFAGKDLRTFLPFFADFDPPRFLTQGDRIQLPVVLRNYTDKTQTMDVKIDPEPWFSVIGAPRLQVPTPAGQDATARFMISADHAVHDGKQRVTAANHDTGDAVERTVAVHPDGEDVGQTVASLLAGDNNALELQIPAQAIPGSIEAELKIYPNLSAHVIDALKGMVERPSGCGEQITSLAYGSLLTLKALRKEGQAGQDVPSQPGNPNAVLARRARKYLNDAYAQLRDLQASDGGFPYWRNGKPDIALTAYVLEFLSQASEFIEVDAGRLDRARNFLLQAQQPDGGWLAWSYYTDYRRPDANLSALVTRSLALSMKVASDKQKPGAPIDKAMKYLEGRIGNWNDAYLVGHYALAAAALGRQDSMARARARLLELAHQEGPGTYWGLEANHSPFYGWGIAGRLETTGLAVHALAVLDRAAGDHANSALLNRGLLFLLNHKDRYSFWYSTQASVKVMQAIVEGFPPEAAGRDEAQATTARVVINGKDGPVLQLPSPRELAGPIRSDISAWLQPGTNRIELVRNQGGSPLQAQLIATHYVRWADSHATQTTNFKPGESRALRLNVSFDTTKASVGQQIQCNVKAERIGFEGYGMMLAEIGLPPGADVDRQSLQQALEKWEVSEYDVLPDRVILYLWPRAGGSSLSFSFKPRFAMEASAAPSVLYDYYNPEARAVIVPARFSVH